MNCLDKGSWQEVLPKQLSIVVLSVSPAYRLCNFVYGFLIKFIKIFICAKRREVLKTFNPAYAMAKSVPVL